MRYYFFMILSFKSKETKKIFKGEFSQKLPQVNKEPHIHPGEILLEEFLRPLALSQYRLAMDIHVPPRRINEIILGKRSVSADTALRLAKYFGNSPEFWMNLQRDYDLRIASDKSRLELQKNVLEYAVAVREKPLVYKRGNV